MTGERIPPLSYDAYKEVEPYLPIAEALKNAIDREVSGEGGQDSGSSGMDIEGAWNEAFRQVGGTLIAAVLSDLPPDKLLALYERHAGDDEYAARLREIAALKVRAQERDLRIQNINLETRATGVLRLDHLEINEMTRIGLFMPMNVGEAYRGSSIPPIRTLTVRWLKPASGEAEIVNDRLTSLRGSSEGTFEPGSILLLGHGVAERQESRALKPELSVHSPLSYRVSESEIAATEEIIGYVESADASLLMNGHR